MTVMTKKREALLDQLIAVAGDPILVEQALRSLNEESATPPTMREIIRRILELRHKRNEVELAPAK
jgi:hypothetical protein